MTWQIDFIKDQDTLFLGEFGKVILISLGERLGSVQHVQNEFGSLETLATAANAFNLDLIGTFAQPGGIDEDNRQAANVGGFFNCVSRCARYG